MSAKENSTGQRSRIPWAHALRGSRSDVNFLSTALNHCEHFCHEGGAFSFSQHLTKGEDGTKMYLGWMTARNAHFFTLQKSVFCAECELISENSTPYCLACGSQAMLSLSRVLGGSLKGRETAHLIVDAELDQLVRDLLRTVPDVPVLAEKKPAASVPMHPGRHHLRTVGFSGANALKLDTAEAD